MKKENITDELEILREYTFIPNKPKYEYLMLSKDEIKTHCKKVTSFGENSQKKDPESK